MARLIRGVMEMQGQRLDARLPGRAHDAWKCKYIFPAHLAFHHAPLIGFADR
jgi:hypothetical protein